MPRRQSLPPMPCTRRQKRGHVSPTRKGLGGGGVPLPGHRAPGGHQEATRPSPTPFPVCLQYEGPTRPGGQRPPHDHNRGHLSPDAASLRPALESPQAPMDGDAHEVSMSLSGRGGRPGQEGKAEQTPRMRTSHGAATKGGLLERAAPSFYQPPGLIRWGLWGNRQYVPEGKTRRGQTAGSPNTVGHHQQGCLVPRKTALGAQCPSCPGLPAGSS